MLLNITMKPYKKPESQLDRDLLVIELLYAIQNDNRVVLMWN